MLNHARCLLMNVDGGPSDPDALCEELVDPDYRAARLPTALRAVREAVFGSDPDRHMLNYRCRQLLTAAEATPLAEYLDAYDPRKTYDYRGDAELVLAAGYSAAVVDAAQVGTTLTLFGRPTAADVTGRIESRVRVEVTTPGFADVTNETTGSKVLLGFAPGDRLPLRGTGMDFRLDSAASGQLFFVTVMARPVRDVWDVVAGVAGLGEPTLIALFGAGNDQPNKTFRELFSRKKELPLRAAALVCALVARTEEVRLRGGR